MRRSPYRLIALGALVCFLALLMWWRGPWMPAFWTIQPHASAQPTPTVPTYIPLVGRAMEATQLPSATATPTVPLVPPTPPPQPTRYTYRVLNEFPHDPSAFTQGLVYEDGIFYEGTGLRGRSSIRKVEVETGRVLQRYDLPAQYFGEGITTFEERLIQLTWQSRVGFIYDKNTFEKLGQFSYPTEGWGLTHDGTRLIMSDGTSTLYFRDPITLEEIGRVEVRDGDTPVVRLNELEYIDGMVYANVWQTDFIAMIDPDTGQVIGWIDLTDLLPPEERAGRRVDVLNGIAYDSEQGRLFVTGKLWPKLYEIALVPLE